jgi:nucleoside-diphosphate-sugar epimerase
MPYSVGLFFAQMNIHTRLLSPVAIIGSGWLGSELARQLLNNGVDVVGTSRNPQKREQLNKAGVRAIDVDVYQPESFQQTELTTAKIWIIAIAAGLNRRDPNAYVRAMRTLIEHAVQTDIERVVFISTSSVYGSATRQVNEDSAVAPQTNSAKAHVEVEEILRELLPKRHYVLRLAGLISEQRHPVRRMVLRSDIENGHHVVNLIHRTDVVNALLVLCEIEPVKRGTLHLCAPDHPSRYEYYTWAAKQLTLPPPQFVLPVDEALQGKTIDCTKSLQALGLALHYTSPFQMLTEQ